MANILIVDDSEVIRMQLSDIIETTEHKVIGVASNGEMGFKLYQKLKPDLVTMDITMPVVSGLEGLKLIREYDTNAKVIMITAMGQKQIILETVKNGAKDYIIKPFQRDRVVETINKALKL